ncbi:alpha/beta hydrolase family esterase [Micromonospora sp. NBC_01796]|uniref:alpha/beta hydrolase family esterase n=1 Tax=Micromonospora sp. NBC_01796 TaxID=2975987 RepID=UPI002DD8FD59|nr:PHB depolymerase family esterase [Micromonospora sp. NBC_01796]WSA84972.1 polyhydroxybutyrate depolymerase [Micromonospora sp. NBC_01796]
MRRIMLWVTALCLLFGLASCDTGEPSAPPVASSPAVQPAPGKHRLTLDHDGVTRRYRVHAPTGYDRATPVPLVIALHPYPGEGLGLSQMIGLDDKAERENFLVAYPDGVNGGFNALVCCGSADDVGFLRALTEHLVDAWGVDPDRVYLTGISNGGDLSFRAAVEATGVFAAIGAVSGGYIGASAAKTDYVPRSPVSVITFIGGQDRYAERFRTGVAAWRERLRCVPATPPPAPVAEAITLTRTRCADGSDVDVYVLDRMGHSWPGAKTGSIAAPEAGLVATDLLWEFFAAHPRLS